MKNSIIKDALILFTITIVAGLLLGLTFSITKEPITQQKIKTRDAALKTVLGDADFQEMDTTLSEASNITNIFSAKKEGKLSGYAFKLETKEGYGGKIEIIVGIEISGVVSGIDIIKHSETPGLGAKADKDPFKDQFKGKPTENLVVIKAGTPGNDEIDSISGATITSRAVTDAVNDASAYYNEHLSKGAK
ncbi:RnfABCDGE type electron transport complex subunit G [Vallitalea pronyensis]|uniref:Ion-translocating oxidoreductase complex subunit G n=1 Tax=Vallitalea pronyensis TaxID=1348613 RepID=A0A8J8MKH6_9FIRM|nr:RnfABCDGE type electron transport complex subunit G [Vallitalea pronyensis]QUI23325.1 RnfABCDGE type electron transport complex subunit G [Vallitalea pronyensis]